MAGDGYAAVAAELRLSADEIRTATEHDDGALSWATPAGTDYGHDGLGAAFDAFCADVDVAAGDLVEQSHELADSLDASAAAYEATDTATADAFLRRFGEGRD